MLLAGLVGDGQGLRRKDSTSLRRPFLLLPEASPRAAEVAILRSETPQALPHWLGVMPPRSEPALLGPAVLDPKFPMVYLRMLRELLSCQRRAAEYDRRPC